MTSYYKVTKYNIDKKSYSAFINTILTPGSVLYEKKKWVRPHKGCGPLCVFESEELTRMWALDQGILNDKYQLWECEIEKSKEDSVWLGDKSQETFLPTGTVFSTSVKLIKKIPWR